MTKLNRKTEYALMALRLIAQRKSEELLSAKEVADRLSTPFDATARVMQVMSFHGLLRAEHGPHGGYTATEKMQDFNLHDFIQMIEGPQSLVKCQTATDSACEIKGSCNIVEPLSVLDQKLNEFYRGIKLSEVIHG